MTREKIIIDSVKDFCKRSLKYLDDNPLDPKLEKARGFTEGCEYMLNEIITHLKRVEGTADFILKPIGETQ